jgi:hypothetical protein
VRHNHHGGMFAGVTGDIFRWPSRAPHELATSERLRRAGVPTPTMLGYVLYRVFPGLCRVDVMTREVPDSHDLSERLLDEDPSRRADAWNATRRLLDALGEIGARHHDLNVKNVLLRHAPQGGYEAMALDVDRVEFVPLGSGVARANTDRLIRSIRKWKSLWGASITEDDILALEHFLNEPHIAEPATSR